MVFADNFVGGEGDGGGKGRGRGEFGSSEEGV